MREDAGGRGWNKRREKMRDRKRGEEEEKERERGNGGAVSETTPSRNLDEETFECTPEGGRRSCGERHNAIDRTTSSELLQFTVFSHFFFHVIPTSFVGKREGDEGGEEGRAMCSSRSGGNFRHS